ncbi:MAG: hypothetical protein KY432_05595, partial [Acidobacteria bacterium]|nr:hypothetical protein [Acidobacteriota bacterium]
SPNYLSSDMRVREMGNAARDYILRRTKDNVLSEMPPKLFRDAEVEQLGSEPASHLRCLGRRSGRREADRVGSVDRGHEAAEVDLQALVALRDENRRYKERFGHIFVVCASGKSADEMLALLRDRIDNAPDEELSIAAEEQRKITHLRLDKLA